MSRLARLIFGRGLRGMRADIAMFTHELKCGWRAAYASHGAGYAETIVLSWRATTVNDPALARFRCPKPHPCRRIHGAAVKLADRLPETMLPRATIGGSGDLLTG
jgi:hypothetical protein